MLVHLIGNMTQRYKCHSLPPPRSVYQHDEAHDIRNLLCYLVLLSVNRESHLAATVSMECYLRSISGGVLYMYIWLTSLLYIAMT